jgi:hypothetical protein
MVSLADEREDIQGVHPDPRSPGGIGRKAMVAIVATVGFDIVPQGDTETRTQSIHPPLGGIARFLPKEIRPSSQKFTSTWRVATTAVVMSEAKAAERGTSDTTVSMNPQQAFTTRRSLKRLVHLSPWLEVHHGNHGIVPATSLPMLPL